VLRRLRIDNLVLIREAELELAPGLNVVTGETGAGKTILAQAIGLLLGSRGDASLVGPDGSDAYVEAELDLPDGVLDAEELESLAELRPSDEPGLAAARRVASDGRGRAYVWGRAAPRDDMGELVERLIAMSGQFEQRRLARPSHQLDLLDAFAGEEQLVLRRESLSAWRALKAARRVRAELARDAGDRASIVSELEALVRAADGLDASTEEELRARRDRLRNAAALTAAASTAAEALAPETGEGEGAADVAARAARELDPIVAHAAELGPPLAEIVDASERLRAAASDLRGFLASLDGEPAGLEDVEDQLGRIADARRRFGAASGAELVERAAAARDELGRLGGDVDPLAEAERTVAAAEQRYRELAADLRSRRTAAAEAFALAAREELVALGLGEGELQVELNERAEGPSGADEASFLVRANAGMPFAPIATTASGGELSRIALALRTVAHAAAGEPTVVFDEIDAGIGGQTAHAVADALRRLASSTQVIAITHLPQIASTADRHFRVEKVPGDPTHTRIELLSEDERQAELERMLGGKEFLRVVSERHDPKERVGAGSHPARPAGRARPASGGV
jgi:DNA repair protein RecN (Recombination protein N)